MTVFIYTKKKKFLKLLSNGNHQNYSLYPEWHPKGPIQDKNFLKSYPRFLESFSKNVIIFYDFFCLRGEPLGEEIQDLRLDTK